MPRFGSRDHGSTPAVQLVPSAPGGSRQAWRAVSAAPIRVASSTNGGMALWKKAGVFEAANIREWRGHDVVDAQGHKIGELEAIYVDTATDLPSFGTVKVGLPTRHRLVFVPLDQATVGPGTSRSAMTRSK
jgi:PRC-barrel domain protein